ncbi:MAG: hypothetical protein ACYC35_11340 [Pirellulales bacterium]
MLLPTTVVAMAVAFGAADAATGREFDKYIWETPATASVQLPADRAWLLEELRGEIDKVLAAGHLAPYYFNAGDLHHEGYFLYVAPGRIITTLAWAYPHLTAAEQAKTREYVARELGHPDYAPWSGRKLPWNQGTGREGFGAPKAFNFDRWWGMEGQYRPSLHTLYGLWLWADRSGDWEGVRKYWPRIKAYYAANAAQAETYGEFGAHIAVARLARHFQDQAAEDLAVDNARKAFLAGRDYAAVEKASLKYFNRLKESRHNFLRSTSFMTMNLCPEVGRFLGDYVKEDVLRKNAAIKASFPHWWLIAPPYGSWAGNIGPDCEAIGLPREVFGMVFPVDCWVAKSDATALSGTMKSGPDGLGDCYWLEPLVWTIEAHGQIRWRDVREESPPDANQVRLRTRLDAAGLYEALGPKAMPPLAVHSHTVEHVAWESAVDRLLESDEVGLAH